MEPISLTKYWQHVPPQSVCVWDSFYSQNKQRLFPVISFIIGLLGRYARVVDHLAVRNVAQGAPLGGGSRTMYRVI